MGYVSEPEVEHPSLRSRDFQIFLGLCVAALAAAVVWLALDGQDHDRSRIDGLQQQVAALQRQVAAARADARAAADALEAQAAQIAALQAQSPPLVARCLSEVQQEIDDIRSFVAFGGSIRRRVSPDCVTLLRPRFAGG